MKVKVTLEFNSKEEAAEFLAGTPSAEIKEVTVAQAEEVKVEEKPKASRSRAAAPKAKATDAVVPHVPSDPFPSAPAEPTTPFPAPQAAPQAWAGIVAPPVEGHAFDSVAVINYVKSEVASAKARGLTDPEIAKAFNDVFAMLNITAAPVSQLAPRELYAFHLKLNGAVVKILENKPQSFI